MNRASTFVLMAIVAAAMACSSKNGGGDGNPVAPSSTTPHIVTNCPDPTQYHSASCPDRTSPTMAIRAQALVNGADVPWSYTFAGLSISGTGSQWTVVEGLSVTDYEVTGQFQQQINFNLNFLNAPRVSGIYKPNSIVGLEGPVSQTSCLSINYAIPAGGATPQTFRFRFTIAAGTIPQPC